MSAKLHDHLSASVTDKCTGGLTPPPTLNTTPDIGGLTPPPTLNTTPDIFVHKKIAEIVLRPELLRSLQQGREEG